MQPHIATLTTQSQGTNIFITKDNRAVLGGFNGALSDFPEAHSGHAFFTKPGGNQVAVTRGVIDRIRGVRDSSSDTNPPEVDAVFNKASRLRQRLSLWKLFSKCDVYGVGLALKEHLLPRVSGDPFLPLTDVVDRMCHRRWDKRFRARCSRACLPHTTRPPRLTRSLACCAQGCGIGGSGCAQCVAP